MLTRTQLIMASHAIEAPMKKHSASNVATGIAIFVVIGLGYFVWKVYF